MLEVLSIHGELVTASCSDLDGLLPLAHDVADGADEDAAMFIKTYSEQVQQLTYTPKIVERTNGSTTMGALNQCDPSVCLEKIKDAASYCETVILGDMPDGCRGMKRCKAATSLFFPDVDNVLYDEAATCFAHALHNTCVHSCGEGNFTGHVHALM